MGSTRFPGKVAQMLAGVPMLRFQVERVLAGGHDVAILTSELTTDDPVVDIANEMGLPVVRGSESDVLGRYVKAVRALEPPFFVRLTADCPLTDPDIITSVVDRFLETGSDYASNIHPRTFPKGLDVEVIRSESLLVAHEEAKAPEEREHVTPYLYRRPERFKLASIRWQVPLGHLNWSVDLPGDLDSVNDLVARVGRKDAGWEDALRAAMADGAEEPRDGLTIRPAGEGDELSILAWRNDPDSVRNSTTQRTVGSEEHRLWFADALTNPGIKLSIAQVDGNAVGMVRIDVNNGVGAVSIAVAPECRGQGYGVAALKALLMGLQHDYQVVRLRGLVRDENKRSARVFERAGFRGTARSDGWITFWWDNPNSESGQTHRVS